MREQYPTKDEFWAAYKEFTNIVSMREISAVTDGIFLANESIPEHVTRSAISKYRRDFGIKHHERKRKKRKRLRGTLLLWNIVARICGRKKQPKGG